MSTYDPSDGHLLRGLCPLLSKDFVISGGHKIGHAAIYFSSLCSLAIKKIKKLFKVTNNNIKFMSGSKTYATYLFMPSREADASCVSPIQCAH